MMHPTYPGETSVYRAARNALLAEELSLRNKIEHVARLRRGLPLGGALKENYGFTATDGNEVRLADLFSRDGRALAIYSLMFRPDADAPCPMCTSLLDGLAGQAPHINQVVDLAVVSAAGPDQLAALSQSRGWTGLRLLSARGTGYQSDYHGETREGAQLPMMNVFHKTPQGVHHFWGSEGFFADIDGQPRHIDQLWPLWNVLDLTPGGRGADWYPAVSYGE